VSSAPFEKFGNQIPFCEPYWYQGYFSPYYTAKHVAFRAKVRAFVERELKPNVDAWLESGLGYPRELHEKAYKEGLGGLIYPREYGGTMPDDFDPFYELIMIDEMSRLAGGHVLGQSAINSMALPPIINHGSQYLKDLVVKDVVQGKKMICLAISEPHAGSDVAGLRCTAVRQGDEYIVNGQKKWITGGNMADYFTTAVRTGDDGYGGISLLLIDRTLPGVSVRKMKTQFDTTHGTTFVTFEDVRVPAKNLIGAENSGFMLLMYNFNHERFVIAAGTCRASRLCYEEAITYALTRKTFGKRLVDHQIIRAKLSDMARKVEALHDNVERVAYQFKMGVSDMKMGAQCAFLKVQASQTFEFCAREATQIFGGSGIVREGRGKIVERLYREVQASAIPGGAETVLTDFAMRWAVAQAAKLDPKL
jgi:alkylation response protein AidB-like acyl-CoA dehydrogenase